MLLNKISRYIKEKKDEGANLMVLRYSGESDGSGFNPVFQAGEHKSVEVIEESDNKLKSRKIISNEKESGFTYFLDGIERKRVLFNYNFIPVTYGHVAAVIMKRTDRKMHSSNLEAKSENIYLPYKTNGDEPEHYFDIEEFAEYGMIPVNIGKKDKETGNYPVYPAEFEQKAHNEIQETRRKLEQELAKKWLKLKLEDDWLFIDGPLNTKGEDLIDDAKVVGIIKSHHVNYFSPEEQFKIYEMKKGERSSVFQPVNENKEGKIEKSNVYSWYLRLQDNNHNGNINFGIIRVEIPANEELLKQVDKISSWILLERNPLAFPDSRWDRMIYPIKYCEDYLKSKAPTWAMIESLS